MIKPGTARRLGLRQPQRPPQRPSGHLIFAKPLTDEDMRQVAERFHAEFRAAGHVSRVLGQFGGTT